MKIEPDIVRAIVICSTITIITALILRHLMEKDEKDRLKEEAGMSAYIGSEADSAETVPAAIAGNGYDKAESDKAVSSNTCVQIEKILSEWADDGSAAPVLKYTSYYLSDVDLDEQTDVTADYTRCITENGFDDSGVTKVSFDEAFGYSYQDCSDMAEFFELLRRASGFDADMTDAAYEEDKHDDTGEDSYEFNEDCSITDILLGDMDYDELIGSSCSYSLSETEDGRRYPAVFTAVVRYMKDGVRYTRTAYVEMEFYKK